MGRIMEAVGDYADKAIPRNGREFIELLIAMYWVATIVGVIALFIVNLL